MECRMAESTNFPTWAPYLDHRGGIDAGSEAFQTGARKNFQ